MSNNKASFTNRQGESISEHNAIFSSTKYGLKVVASGGTGMSYCGKV